MFLVGICGLKRDTDLLTLCHLLGVHPHTSGDRESAATCTLPHIRAPVEWRQKLVRKICQLYMSIQLPAATPPPCQRSSAAGRRLSLRPVPVQRPV